MKTVEEDTAEEDEEVEDLFSCDWLETAYDLPEPNLITEKEFNEHAYRFLTYKDYFNYVRETYQVVQEEVEDVVKDISCNPDIMYIKNCNKKVSVEVSSSDMANAGFGNNETLNQLTKNESVRSYEPEIKGTGGNKNVPNTNNHFGFNHTNYHRILFEPKKTKITAKDRRFYHAFIKNKNRVAEKPDNQEKMKQLLIRIRNEQDEYQQFLHHSASVNMNSYLYLDEHVKSTIISSMQKSVLELLKPPVQKFSHLKTLDFNTFEPTTNKLFEFKRCVYEEGCLPDFELPPTNVKLSNMEIDLSCQIPADSPIDRILSICTENESEVYIKDESLLSIMEGLVSPSREWVLSVKVEEVEIDNQICQKTIIFDKCLPRRVMSSREVNKLYYNKVFKQTTLKHFGNMSKLHDEKNAKMSLSEQGINQSPDTPCRNNSNKHINLFSLNDMQVLVETSIDQYDNQMQKSFHISPKCEYQVSVGFEQFSIVDLCQLWWNSKMSNTDSIICSRVDIRNDVVARNDVYTRDVLCPPESPYCPNYFCSHLYHMLVELRTLDVGWYVLEHSVGQNQINIFNQNDSGLPFDVLYNEVLNGNLIIDNASQWLPIDTTILSQTFIENEWMSCLFKLKRTGAKRGRKKEHLEMDHQSPPLDNIILSGTGHVTSRQVMSYTDEF